MAKKVYLLQSHETYQGDVEALLDCLHQAVAAQDVRQIKAALNGLRDVVRHVRLSLQRKYGRIRVGMSGYKLPSWGGATPREVLDDVENAIGINKIALEPLRMKLPATVGKEKKALAQEIRKLEGYIKAVIRKGYRKFEDQWPGWLTPGRVAHFKKYFPGEEI
jgi:hypothetical protein